MGTPQVSGQDVERDPRFGFGMTIGEVSRQWRLMLDHRLRPLGLTFARWAVLVTLDVEGPLSQVELARYVGVEAPSMVRQIDKLENEGLVRRTSHPDDRRIKLVELDESAREISSKIKCIAGELRDEIFAGIDEEQIRLAHRALLTIRDRMSAMQSS